MYRWDEQLVVAIPDEVATSSSKYDVRWKLVLQLMVIPSLQYHVLQNLEIRGLCSLVHRRRKQFHFGGTERNIHCDNSDLRCMYEY